MSDDGFDDGVADDGEADEFAELRAELSEVLEAYADKHGLDDGDLAILLLDAAVRHRTFSYAVETGKPSEGGLKLDLDRFARAFGDMVREAKKEAGPIVQDLVAALAAPKDDEAGA